MTTKVKLKPYIRDTNYQHLTVDKWYEAEFIYISLDQTKPHFYRVECDDGVKRKFIPNLFVSLEVWRDTQLEKMLYK